MLDWDDLRHFLAIQRTGALNRAAATLRINATTVGRRLSALESEIGARLFDRTPDGFVLTQAGTELLPRAERMEQEALALEREVVGADQKAEGVVRIAATEMLVTRFIAPHLPEFHAATPEITLDLVCTNRHVNLGRREADVALRLSRPKEENVVTRRLADIPLALYASTGYVETYGIPARPEQTLRGHRLLLFSDTRAFRLENDWIEPRVEGASVVLRSDSVSSIYAAAASGLGIALLPCAVADPDPGLRCIETETSPEPRVVWQTIHADLRSNARIRRVLEFLQEVVSERPRSGSG